MSEISHDVLEHGLQTAVYKLMKYLNETEKERVIRGYS